MADSDWTRKDKMLGGVEWRRDYGDHWTATVTSNSGDEDAEGMISLDYNGWDIRDSALKEYGIAKFQSNKKARQSVDRFFAKQKKSEND